MELNWFNITRTQSVREKIVLDHLIEKRLKKSLSVLSYWEFSTDEINQKISWTINIEDLSWWHKFMSGKCDNLKLALLYVNKFHKYAHFAMSYIINYWTMVVIDKPLMCLSGFTYKLYKNDSINNRNNNVKMENM